MCEMLAEVNVPCTITAADDVVSPFDERRVVNIMVEQQPALCRGFDPCRQRPQGVAVDFGPKRSGWLINQLGDPSLNMGVRRRRKFHVLNEVTEVYDLNGHFRCSILFCFSR